MGSETNGILRIIERSKGYLDWARVAQSQTGKGLLEQAKEIAFVRQLGGQCGISDYYWYKLYDPAYQEGRGAADFVGWKLQAKYSLALNPRNVVLPAWDKSAFMVMGSAAGLPVAPVRAFFHRAAHVPALFGEHLRTVEDAAKFLRDKSSYPLFGKPSYSQQGYGSEYLTDYDRTTDTLGLINGTRVGVIDFLARLEHPIDKRYHRPESGFLFQESFTLTPELLAFTKWPAICGVRVVCINGPEGAQPVRAIWKIATPPNHVDNFSLGKNGNLLANVDLATGAISKVIGGFWPNTKVFDMNPVSGVAVKGLNLPFWQQVLDACRIGGDAFPLMRIQHWDFALTDKGPFILELNDLGGTEIAQVHGHGLLTPRIREFFKRHGNMASHPWIAAL